MSYAQLKEDDLYWQVRRNYHFEISRSLLLLLSKPKRSIQTVKNLDEQPSCA